MCYGFSVLAGWFMAHSHTHNKNETKITRHSLSRSLCLSLAHCPHFQLFHGFLVGMCVVRIYNVHRKKILFSCMPSDIVSDRHTHALEPMTLTFYDWISDDISIIPWFWWHVPMCLSQWCSARMSILFGKFRFDSMFLASAPPPPLYPHQAIWKFDWNTLKIIDRHSYFFYLFSVLPSHLFRSTKYNISLKIDNKNHPTPMSNFSSI